MVNDIAVQDFVNAIKETPTDTNTTYQATVSRIDDEGVVWVCIHGSEKETPTASTSAEVKRGDSVTVQWRSNKLYIGGNYSNPSAGIGTVMPSVDFVTELIDKDITVNSINAATGYIGELTSKKITAEDITADHATIKELDVESMAAATAYIRELTADNITAEDIVTDHATVGNLDANYAQINAANVTDLSAQNAWVNKIMVQTGLLAHEGTVFTLDAIQVNAANITAGTIDVNRLIVTVDGEKYLVEIDPTTHQPSYEKLDGGIVEPRTITADKIVAHDITVQEITTENLVGTNGWINLNLGRFFYGNGANYASSTNAIDWNGTTLKIKGDIGDSVVFNNYSTTTEMNTAIGNAVDGIKAIHVLDSAYLSTGQPFETILGWCEVSEVRFDINTTSTPLTGVKIGDTARIRYLANNVGNNGTEVYLVGSVSAVGADYIKAKSLSLESTVVDGGHILTGTIDTNRLNANTIKSQIVQTTELNADKITSGKVAATYIDTDHITIGQSQVNNLSTDLNSIKAQYGYTTTTAGTAAKEVVLANYVDRVGAIIGVRFANGNTVSPITLNVNGTGAKTVQSVDPINDLPAATTCNFIRDEFNQWRYLGSDASSWVSKEYASALSSAKQISTYTRSFAKADWDTYGANGHSESWSASSSSGYDNTHISVGDKAYLTGQVSDKAGWHAAILGTVTAVSTTAVIMTSIKVLYNSAQTEKYITKIDENGIFVSPSGNSPSASSPQNSVKINADGLYVYSGGVEQAYFTSSAARIGRNVANTSHATILDNGMHIWTGVESTASNEVAFFGATARVGVPAGKRFEIKSDGAYIYNGTTQLGYYGSFTRIGDYNGKNVRIDGDGIKLNSAQDTQVASFSADTIELGKNSTASQIKLCGGYGTISVSNSTIGILGNYGGASLSASASYGSSMVYCSNDNVLINATTNGREGADLWVTSNSDEGDVVTADCTQLQLIGRSGAASSLWLTGGTVPPSGSGTTAVWHQSSAGNYGLYRSSSSSRRYKEDIKPVEDDRLDPHRLYDLEVVQFKYKEGYFLPDEPYEQNRVNLIGFIAEDVLEHYPQAVLMENEEVENWEIRYIVPPMLKLIQEQNDRITELERRLS